MRNKITSIVLLICLLCPTLLPFQNEVEAISTPNIKLLEITDGATDSTLSKSQQSLYDVTTVPIKKFVADRSELEGKYDAIYFASGSYSTDLVPLDPDPTSGPNTISNGSTRRANNLTKSKMNDLTLLKANEITDFYIKNNLPVLFNDSIKNQKCNTKLKPNNQCILKNLAQNYVRSEYPNVRYVSEPSTIPILTTNRPRFKIITQPTDSATATNPYNVGDVMTYTFSIDKGNPNELTANLYIDTNFDTKYEPSELVKREYVKNLGNANSGYTLQYTLPKGYSGIRMWKLEITGENGLKDYKTGNLRFRDVKVDIRVLQVTKTASKNGSLLKVLNNVGLSGNVIETNDYRMAIDVISMDDFNNSEYTRLNTGSYNMIVFGFEDSYGNKRITNAKAQQAVKEFIASGQSIFMTHDTIQRIPAGASFEETNTWIQNFLSHTGQTYELGVTNDWQQKTEAQKVNTPGLYYMETNLGYQAKYTVTKAKKVNNALITSFPYSLNDTIVLATTHSQYFTLDLEDPEVIPLYNLENTNDTSWDSNDSYNMYYIYKRKNITYSGAGHTSSNFSIDEQKLFVNTMLASFIGANQAPTITVYSPNSTKEIPTTQKIPLSFKVDDIDINDTNLNYSILLNGVQIRTGKILNGQTINEEISHGLVNDGTAKITIQAWDNKGAQAGQQDIVVKIKKLNENLSISRKMNKTNILKVGKDITKVTYTITPNEIDGSELNNNIQTLKVSNIEFKEVVPANFTVAPLSNLKVVENTDNTKTITRSLDSIIYTKTSNDKYIAGSITFDIDYMPTVSGDFTLAKSTLNFTSVDNTNKTLTFNSINVSARDELKSIKTPESITMNINSVTPQRILVEYDPPDALAQGIIKQTTWEVSEGNDLISVSESGVVSIKPGAFISEELKIAKVKVTVTDIFDSLPKEKTINVIITNPLQSILVDEKLTVNVGETGSLHLIVIPSNAINRLNWTIDHPEFVEIDKLTGIVKGLEKGTTTVTIKGIGENNKEIIKTVVITVKQPVTSIQVDSPILIEVGQSMNLLEHTNVLPLNANNRDVVYSLVSNDDQSYVQLTEAGVILAKAVPVDDHLIKVRVTSKDGSIVTKEFYVKITWELQEINFTRVKIDLEAGKTIDLSTLLKYIPTNTTQTGISEWISNDRRFVTVDSNGTAHGISKGYATVTAISKYGQHKASIYINVYDSKDGGNGNSGNDLKW